MKNILATFSLIGFAFLSMTAFASHPDDALDDPMLEARARALDTQLRCVVCQSQSIAESDAPLARDLRMLVRERISAGDSDSEAINYLVDRYGDYVLLKPRVQHNTVILWGFPFLMVITAGAFAYFSLKRFQKPLAATPLSEEDEKIVQTMIKERD